MKQCLCEKCWKGYVKRGYKTLFGKRYPNCVKKSKAGKRRESVKEAERKMSSLEMQQVILLAKAMKQMPGSPAQKKIKQQINVIRKKLGQKPVKESVNEESKTIKSIQNLADKNKYGTVSGTRMNGKTAKEIIAIYNHPKMKSFRGKMDKMKSHELMDLTIRLPKMLGIKVESVNEGKLDRIASTLVADLNKEFIRYNPKKISDFNKLIKYLGKKMPRVPKSKIEDIAMTFDEIMRDEAGNVVVNSREQRARMKTTLKKLGMKESVNEKVDKIGAIKKAFPWAKGKMMNVIQMAIEMDVDGLAGVMKNYKANPSAYKQFVRDMSKMKGLPDLKESVNEAVEPRGNIKKVLDVAKNKQAKKIGGTLVDGTTANMMTQVWNKVNDSSKEKMNKMNTKQLINLILRLWKAMGTPKV